MEQLVPTLTEVMLASVLMVGLEMIAVKILTIVLTQHASMVPRVLMEWEALVVDAPLGKQVFYVT